MSSKKLTVLRLTPFKPYITNSYTIVAVTCISLKLILYSIIHLKTFIKVRMLNQ